MAWQNFAYFPNNTLFLAGQEYPPPQMKSFPEMGTLSFDYPRIPPPPWKLKFDQKLALWVLTTQEFPPPQLKFGQNLALWVLTTKNTHFPPIEIWPELGTFSFHYPKIPPPNQKMLQLECVETNRCIPQGYRLVNECQDMFSLPESVECSRLNYTER